MSEPNTSADSFAYAVPASIVVFFGTFMLFQWEQQWAYFSLALYLGLPVLIYLLTSAFTFLAHYSACTSLRISDVFLYSLPSLGATWAALGISWFSWPRIPIASVVAPLFIGNSVDVVRTPDNKACCAPQLTLETIEARAPMVKGFAYGFYLFFSTLFSLLISIGFSTAC